MVAIAPGWTSTAATCPHACDDTRRYRGRGACPIAAWRTTLLVVTSFDGAERIEVDGRAHGIAGGGGYLIAPGQLHTLASERGKSPGTWNPTSGTCATTRAAPAVPLCRRLRCRAGRGAPALLQPSPREVWDADLPVALPAPAMAALRAAVPRVISAWQHASPWSRWDANHELGGLLLQLVVACVGGDQPAGEPVQVRLERAEAVARRSLGAEFGVAEFAAAAGYSRSRFCAVYRANRGVGPGAFLRSCRLALARELLKRGELTVRAVGGLVGYPEPSVFGRAFRAAYGQTPQAWRDSGSA